VVGNSRRRYMRERMAAQQQLVALLGERDDDAPASPGSAWQQFNPLCMAERESKNGEFGAVL